MKQIEKTNEYQAWFMDLSDNLVKRNGQIIVLLAGGSKSTQKRDITLALELARNL
jgi:putative component of toxin-antitoxin plasmid stabilization module